MLHVAPPVPCTEASVLVNALWLELEPCLSVTSWDADLRRLARKFMMRFVIWPSLSVSGVPLGLHVPPSRVEPTGERDGRGPSAEPEESKVPATALVQGADAGQVVAKEQHSAMLHAGGAGYVSQSPYRRAPLKHVNRL